MNRFNLPEEIWNRIQISGYTKEDLEYIHKLSKKQNKYRNKNITIDGHTFPSIKEANRYCELKILEKAGEIVDLELQPSFEICPQVKWNGKTLRKRVYISDFMYTENGKKVVEDSKGFRNKTYLLKRSLFLSQYPQYLFKES